MPKLAANLSTMFTEHDFLDRFAAAAQAGFQGVECQFPYAVPAEEIAHRLRRHGLRLVLFNLPPGDFAAGERGLAALPGREAEFAESVEQAIRYSTVIDCKQLHALAGIAPESHAATECETVYVTNLRHAADRLAPLGITLLIEPINRRDMPGFFLNTADQALAIIERVSRPNVSLQFDLYHCQISEGDVATKIRALAGRFAHVQIAGVPERNEPDQGELNYPYLLNRLDASGYRGWVGCEYRPRGATTDGLTWAEPWGIKPRR